MQQQALTKRITRNSRSTARNKLRNRRQRRDGSVPSPSPDSQRVALARTNGRHAGSLAKLLDQLPWTKTRRQVRRSVSVSTNWPANGLPVLWKQPIGVGHASFAVADGKAYTIEQRRSQEVVAAYDVNNGRELWTQKWNAEFSDSTGDGPRATPTWDQGRIYALGATGELRCLDASNGSVIWGKNILSDNGAEQSSVGHGCVAADRRRQSRSCFPAARLVNQLSLTTRIPARRFGKCSTTRKRMFRRCWLNLAGRRQIVVVSSYRVVGLAPENGTLLWSYPWDTDMRH